MGNEVINIISGVIVEDDESVSLSALCRCCSLPAEQVIGMVDQGIIEPLEPQVTSSYWQFSGESIIRVQAAIRLQRDLGINLPGTALALELLDEVKALRQQVSCLQRASVL
ncbi:MAG: chaperone modulator CbpM [Methyloprofundus sp.]|nr:chaperone modulator CbpM [Methyloprofundus sp.]MDT8425085.1 chaperone modulator CbpM [Methyloprofundus sp.]